jgi:hypothetical protein
MRKLLLISLGSTLLLLADDRANRTLAVAHTDRFPVPASVSIHFEKSFGEIDVDGWDQPEVEITVTKSIEDLAGGHTRAQQRLDTVEVSVKHIQGDVAISTVYPEQRGISHVFGRRGDVDITYRIHAPRGAKLIVDHNTGELNVAGITGDVRAIVAKGQITMTLPDGSYAIDAQCKVGRVYSDFEGHDHSRRQVGEDFSRQGMNPAANLYLRTGFGDIMILKSNHSLRTE